MDFQETLKQFQLKNYQAAALSYIAALQTSDEYLNFVQITSMDQLIEEKQLELGQSITVLVELANLKAEQFRQFFFVLIKKYQEKLEKQHFYMLPLELYMTLFLYSFLAMFLGIQNDLAMKISNYYFDKYEENGLPDSYCLIFAEQCTINYILNKEYERAWQLEKSQKMLQKLMLRDGKEILQLICMLVNLHLKFCKQITSQDEKCETNDSPIDDIKAIVETLKLRFGDEEFEKALQENEI